MTPLSKRMFNNFQSRNGGRRISTLNRSRSEFTPLLVDRDDISEPPNDSIRKKRVSSETDHSSLQNWLIYWLDSSVYSRWWDVFDTLLNAAFVTSYVVMTTFCRGQRGQVPPPAPPPQYLEFLDYLFAIVLLVQWLPRLYMTLDPLKLLRSMVSIFTLLSTLPVLFVYTYLPADRGSFLDGGMIVLLYPLRFWRLHLSLGNLLRPGRNVLINVSLITQKALTIGFSIFNTLFTVTAWVHLCIYKYQGFYDLTFFDVFYTIAVSSTSGLSTEIVPDNYFSRIITLYVMIVGAIFIPTNLSDLLVLIRSKSKYDRRFQPTAKQDHIILVGHFEVSHLRDFLREFYCDDHGSRAVRTQVVLMNPNEPSEELVRLLADPLYTNRVKYVKGSTMSFRSLHKVKANEAEAIFILASRFNTNNAVEEDAKMVMRALSIHRFNPKVDVFAHVLMPHSKVHLEDLVDHIICIDEFKMGMLAQNCLAPGFSTLLHLLTTSISDQSVMALKKKFNQHPWVEQYLNGATMEIYAVNLTEKFAGMTFSQACARIYVQFHAVLFALGVDDENDVSEVDSIESESEFEDNRVPHYIILNPQRYVLRGFETAYLITTDHKIATKIAEFDLEDVDDTWRRASPLFSPDLETGIDVTSPLQQSSVASYGAFGSSSSASFLPPPFQSLQNLISPPPASAESITPTAAVSTPIPPRRGDVLSGMMESPMTPGASTTQSTPSTDNEHANDASATSVPDVRSSSSGRKAIQHSDDLIEIRSRRPGRSDSNTHALEEEAPTAELVALSSPRIGSLDLAAPKDDEDGASPESSGTVRDKRGEDDTPTATGWKRILPYFAVDHKTAIDSPMLKEPKTHKKNHQEEDHKSFPADVKDHILVCSLGDDFPSNLAYFIAPVRHKELTKPIIILSNGTPSEDEWNRLSAFGHVHHSVGTPLLRRDLKRARVHYASRAVVLANSTQEDMEDRSADAPALLAVMNIQAMCALVADAQHQLEDIQQQNEFTDVLGEDGRPIAALPQKRTFIIVEFFHPENMKFVGAFSRETMSSFSSKHTAVDATELHHHHLIPAFIGGHVFSESMFHSILCQTYYNPHLPYILKLFLFNGLGTRSTTYTKTDTRDPSSSRQNSIESILGIPEGENMFGNLFQITLPSDGRFVGMPYGSLFTFLVHCHSVVALGLYRRTVQLQSRAKGNVIKYVIVNPSPDLKLQADDALFILGEKPIVWNT